MNASSYFHKFDRKKVAFKAEKSLQLPAANHIWGLLVFLTKKSDIEDIRCLFIVTVISDLVISGGSWVNSTSNKPCCNVLKTQLGPRELFFQLLLPTVKTSEKQCRNELYHSLLGWAKSGNSSHNTQFDTRLKMKSFNAEVNPKRRAKSCFDLATLKFSNFLTKMKKF